MWWVIPAIILTVIIVYGVAFLVAASRDDDLYNRDAGDGYDQYREPPK